MAKSFSFCIIIILKKNDLARHGSLVAEVHALYVPGDHMGTGFNPGRPACRPPCCNID